MSLAPLDRFILRLDYQKDKHFSCLIYRGLKCRLEGTNPLEILNRFEE